jgi:N-methylhydantoinase A
MCRKAHTDMSLEGFSSESINMEQALDLRYQGQSYEIMVPYKGDTSYIAAFHKEHRQLYAYNQPHQPVEIVNLRVKATGISQKIRLKKQPLSDKSPQGACFKSQNLYYQGRHYRAQVYKRDQLKPGNEIAGPALVVDLESTTFIPPELGLQVDPYLNLILKGRG